MPLTCSFSVDYIKRIGTIYLNMRLNMCKALLGGLYMYTQHPPTLPPCSSAYQAQVFDISDQNSIHLRESHSGLCSF